MYIGNCLFWVVLNEKKKFGVFDVNFFGFFCVGLLM